MSTHRPGPLDVEERDLAQRLARVGPLGEPSPALDARILSAAHAAIARQSPRRAHRRWPVAFGVAASLALAVGIAWQLRPLPQAAPAYEEAAAPIVDPVPPERALPGVAADARVARPPAARRAPAAEGAPAGASSPAHEAGRQTVRPSARNEVTAPAAAVTEPPVVFDQPIPADVQAAPAAAPAPPPPAPPAPAAALPDFTPAPAATATPASTMEQRARKESVSGAANAQQRAVAEDAARTRASEAKEASVLEPMVAGASEEVFDERPPSTADLPEVRQAWLQRIRELLAGGEVDAARDSLQEFKRRHPGAVLPEDLRRFDQPPP